jgi:hypothetical protein
MYVLVCVHVLAIISVWAQCVHSIMSLLLTFLQMCKNLSQLFFGTVETVFYKMKSSGLALLVIKKMDLSFSCHTRFAISSYTKKEI